MTPTEDSDWTRVTVERHGRRIEAWALVEDQNLCASCGERWESHEDGDIRLCAESIDDDLRRRSTTGREDLAELGEA